MTLIRCRCVTFKPPTKKYTFSKKAMTANSKSQDAIGQAQFQPAGQLDPLISAASRRRVADQSRINPGSIRGEMAAALSRALKLPGKTHFHVFHPHRKKQSNK